MGDPQDPSAPQTAQRDVSVDVKATATVDTPAVPKAVEDAKKASEEHDHEPVEESFAAEFIKDVRKLFFLEDQMGNFYYDAFPQEHSDFQHGY
jgi:hypothetical protein